MTEDTCVVDGCDKSVLSRGYCSAHYQRLLKHGDPHGGRPARVSRSGRSCSISGCTRSVVSRGYCEAHYHRLRRYGDPQGGSVIPYGLSPESRFWRYVQRTETCWLWTGGLSENGYGLFWSGVSVVRAHRWAYEHLTEEIPDGYEVDHLCRVRHCVNPHHLEPVTRQVNVQRGAHVRRDLRVAARAPEQGPERENDPL